MIHDSPTPENLKTNSLALYGKARHHVGSTEGTLPVFFGKQFQTEGLGSSGFRGLGRLMLRPPRFIRFVSRDVSSLSLRKRDCFRM